MPLAGAGFGAAKALEEILADQMLRAKLAQQEQQQAAAMQLDRDRLAETQRQFNVRADADDRKRRDDNNARGLDLMQSDKRAMDVESAIAGLPTHLKSLGPLVKIDALGKMSPQDLEDPQVVADRAAKAREQNVNDQIRIRQASSVPSAPKDKKQVWVKRGDQVVPIEEGTAVAGDIPYDQVAARSSKPEDVKEAQDTASEASRLASALLQHPGFEGAFGLAGSYVPTMRQSTADAESLLGSLQSMLTMENMGKMKGVLSDSDMKVLRQASTTLTNRMSEGAARQELQRIVEVMGKVGGAQAPASATVAPAVDPKVLELIKKYGGGG